MAVDIGCQVIYSSEGFLHGQNNTYGYGWAMHTKKTQIPSTTKERREWIKYQLRLKNTSLADIAIKNGVSRKTYSATLAKPNKKRELHIAEVIGVKPSLIWPERYKKGN